MTNERTDFLCDILVAAVEGGIGYWCETRNYEWFANDGHKDLTHVRVEINDHDIDNEDEDADQWKLVDHYLMEVGIARIKDELYSVEMNPELKEMLLEADRENDATNVDSEIADCVVQVALFGKIIYG